MSDDPRRFGRIAIDRGLVEEARLAEALRRQEELAWEGTERPIGRILVDMGLLTLEDVRERYMERIPGGLEPAATDLPPEGLCFRTAVSRFENELINQALQRTQGNKNKAADLLRLNRTTLVEKIKRRQIALGKS